MIKTLLRSFLFCTISIFISATLKAQTWPVIGSDGQIASGSTAYTSITTADVTLDSVSYVSLPHVAFAESGVAKVKRYRNGAWESVGGNITTGGTTYTYIFSDDNGKLYLNYVDESTAGAKRLAVKTFNSATNTWEALGGNAANLYLSIGSIVQNLGSALNSSHNSWMAFDSNNVPYVIYSEFDAGGVPYVKRFNGTAWEVVGGGAVSADKAAGVGIVFNPSTSIPYLVYCGGTGTTSTLKVYKLNGAAWSNIAFPATTVTSGSNTYTTINGATSGAISASRHSSVIFDNDNNLNIAHFNSGNSNKATVIKYVESTATWSLSGVVSTRDSPNINLVKGYNGNLYVSFTDAYTNGSGRSVARVMKLAVGSSSWTELTNAEITTGGIEEPVSSLSITTSSNGNEYIAYTKSSVPVVRTFSSAPPTPVTPTPDVVVTTPKQMEYLTRAVTAVRVSTSQVLVSWRLLGTDPAGISFNVYRNGTKITSSPITNSTNYQDNISSNGIYTIKPVINDAEGNATAEASVWSTNYLNIPIQQPSGGTTPDNVTYTYNANDASVGDVDGDGEYEIILKWDPSNSKDNSLSGYTGNVFIDAYKLNGTKLWRIDLGKNIRAGAHYTQFMVYDLDCDGKAEVACKTADGTIDGTGEVIGSSTADYRNSSGYVLSGPEYLTIFNGLTGKAMATANFNPGRGTVSSWGDNYGNRVDRFISAVAYLDGAKPSLIMGRGYYTRLVRTAWDWRNGELKQRWIFDSNTAGNSSYYGQGNHQMSVADVDGDGKDEILNGSSTINDDGKGLWTDSKGHGDALHVTDMDPTTPEQEEWMNHEEQGAYAGMGLRLKNAKTGATLWGIATTGDVGRSMAADIDPQYPGYEVWASSGGNVYTNKGVSISTSVPSYNFGLWWDGDLSREILDGTKLDKWNTSTKKTDRLYTIYNAAPIASNNSTKSNPCLTADIVGDWREEMLFRAADNQSLYLFTTPYVTDKRIYTLMHDSQYRVAVAWQNSAYNQPPYPSFFLGTDMATPQTPNISLTGATALPINLIDFKAKASGDKVNLSWSTASETNNKYFTVERSSDGKSFEAVLKKDGAGNSSAQNQYFATDFNPLAGTSYYSLRQTDADGKSTTSGSVAVTILKNEEFFSLAPNPVQDRVVLNYNSSSSDLQLSVTSLDGRSVLNASGSIAELNAQLNAKVNLLATGVYILQLFDTGKSYTQKMMKR